MLDPHKSMFLPYGTGVLLVREEQTLRTAHAAGGDYLQDIGGAEDLPDYAHLGPELTREWRGLRLWLPLHLHGVVAFRAALDEKLDLARWIHRELAAEPALELPWVPDLTVVGFDCGAPGLPGRPRTGGCSSESTARVGSSCPRLCWPERTRCACACRACARMPIRRRMP